MKKRYFLSLLQITCFLLLNLLLQGCGGGINNLPLEGGEEPTYEEWVVQEGEEGQVTVIGREEESNILPTLMPELWQYIFSYLDFKGVLTARAVNSDWNKLITGFRQAGVVGVENKPSHIIDARSWVKREEIDFKSNKLESLKPSAILSFAFYHLIGYADNLPQSFWYYLQGSKIHTVDLSWNSIGDQGAEVFAKYLQGTCVHTVDLWANEIGDQGVEAFARLLQATKVHTIYLSGNKIGNKGAEAFAKHLQGTCVHTVDLIHNNIGDEGAEGFAKHLQGTQEHMVNLKGNQIGEAMQKLLKTQYSHIKWAF